MTVGDGMRGSRFLAWPVTARGRKALRLFIAIFPLLAVMGVFALIGNLLLADENGTPPAWTIVLMMLPAAGAAVCALWGGVLSVLALREGDRSWVVWLPLLAGANALFFLVGEFIPPGH